MGMIEVHLRHSRLWIQMQSDVFPHHRSQRCYKRYNSDDKPWFRRLSVGRTRSAERRAWEDLDTLSWQLFLLESVHNNWVTATPCPILITKLKFSAGNGKEETWEERDCDTLAFLNVLEASTWLVSSPNLLLSKSALFREWCHHSRLTCHIGSHHFVHPVLPSWLCSIISINTATTSVSTLIFFCVDGCHRSCHHKFYPFNPFSTILSNADLITLLYCIKFLKRFPITDCFPNQGHMKASMMETFLISQTHLSPSAPIIYTLCSIHIKLYYFLFPWYPRVSQPHAFGLALLPASHLSPQVSFSTSTSLAKCPYPVHISILSFLALLTYVYFLYELKNTEGYWNQYHHSDIK